MKFALNFPDPNTLDEAVLREQLRLVQAQAADLAAMLESISALRDRLCDSLHSTTRAAHGLGDLLARLCAARVSGDDATVAALLDEIIRDNHILPPALSLSNGPAGQRLH